MSGKDLGIIFASLFFGVYSDLCGLMLYLSKKKFADTTFNI